MRRLRCFAAMEAIMNRLLAAKSVLSSALSVEELQLLSQTQAAAVIVLTERHIGGLSAESCATLSEEACKTGWHGAHKAKVLGAFTQRNLRADCNRRRDMQDYESFLDFFSINEWKTMGDDAVSMQAKRSVVMQRLLALGLRCPKEATTKLANSLVVFIGSDNPSDVGEGAMRDYLTSFKAGFKKAAAAMPDPPTYLAVLPASPAQLLSDAPMLYKMAYGAEDDGPSRCLINANKLRELDATVRCRGGAAPMRRMTSFAGAQSSGGLEQIGSMFMQGMQQMQQQNMQMMQHMLQGRGAPLDLQFSVGSKRPRSLMTLPADAANLDGGGHVAAPAMLADREEPAAGMDDSAAEVEKPPETEPPQKRQSVRELLDTVANAALTKKPTVRPPKIPIEEAASPTETPLLASVKTRKQAAAPVKTKKPPKVAASVKAREQAAGDGSNFPMGTQAAPAPTTRYNGGRIQVSFAKKSYRVFCFEGQRVDKQISWKSDPAAAFAQAKRCIDDYAKANLPVKAKSIKTMKAVKPTNGKAFKPRKRS